MTRKEDALVRMELHLTSAQCFRLMDRVKNIDFYYNRIEHLQQEEFSDKRQESIRACQEWIKTEERNIGETVWGNVVLKPQELDRAAAVAIWESALHSGKNAPELIDLLRSLQLKVIGHLRDPLGFFLREPVHQGLLQRKKVDSVQTGQQGSLVSCLLSEAPLQDIRRSDGFGLLASILNTLDEAFSIQSLGKREIQRTRSNAGNDELCSVLAIEGRTVVISVF